MTKKRTQESVPPGFVARQGLAPGGRTEVRAREMTHREVVCERCTKAASWFWVKRDYYINVMTGKRSAEYARVEGWCRRHVPKDAGATDSLDEVIRRFVVSSVLES